jgi:hypothetical protein
MAKRIVVSFARAGRGVAIRRLLTRAALSLSILVAGTPRAGAEERACFPAATVPEGPESPALHWISKAKAVDVRRYLASIAGRWVGDTLIVSCSIQGPAYEGTGATIEGDDLDDETQRKRKAVFLKLAEDAGRSPEEGEAIANRYLSTVGGFFRIVPDGKGSTVSEEQVIRTQHERELGVAKSIRSDEIELQGSAEALEAKVKAAVKAGNIAEAQRLVTEARLGAKSDAMVKKNARQTWAVLKASLPDLAAASYWTRITVGQSFCLPCRLPEVANVTDGGGR